MHTASFARRVASVVPHTTSFVPRRLHRVHLQLNSLYRHTLTIVSARGGAELARVHNVQLDTVLFKNSISSTSAQWKEKYKIAVLSGTEGKQGAGTFGFRRKSI